jgi:hypothetical protein
MELKVLLTEDPTFVLSRAEVFLSSQPVLNNLVLTILHARVAQGDPGRYWIAVQGDDTFGVVLQSPLTSPATLTPMEPSAAMALAEAIAEAGAALPGISGEAATTARFADQWSERSKSAATPFPQNRLYELLEIGEAPDREGNLRQAGKKDRSIMILWDRAFQHEIGEPTDDIELRVDRGLAAGQLWLWDRRGEAVSMAVTREPIQGVVRLSGVYTPPNTVASSKGESALTQIAYRSSAHLEEDFGWRKNSGSLEQCVVYSIYAEYNQRQPKKGWPALH